MEYTKLCNIKSIIKQIEEEINCPYNFECLHSEINKLSEVKDINLNEFVQCLNEKCETCEMSLTFGSIRLCKCPIRVYIEKNDIKKLTIDDLKYIYKNT